MAAQLIDGKALAARIRAGLLPRVEQLAQRGERPGLHVLLAGDDAASAVYVRHKVKACAEVGIASRLDHLPASTSEAALRERIATLNADPSVHGILVQLPLPKTIDPQRVLADIAADKD